MPLVDTIKVETQPTVEQVRVMVDALGGKLTVLGGAGGGTLVEAFRRGAQGTMPFASQAVEFMQVWGALTRGDEPAAEGVVESRILPVSRLGFQGRDLFYHVHKAILRRRLCDTSTVRPPTVRPDAITLDELDNLLARLGALSTNIEKVE